MTPSGAFSPPFLSRCRFVPLSTSLGLGRERKGPARPRSPLSPATPAMAWPEPLTAGEARAETPLQHDVRDAPPANRTPSPSRAGRVRNGLTPLFDSPRPNPPPGSDPPGEYGASLSKPQGDAAICVDASGPRPAVPAPHRLWSPQARPTAASRCTRWVDTQPARCVGPADALPPNVQDPPPTIRPPQPSLPVLDACGPRPAAPAPIRLWTRWGPRWVNAQPARCAGPAAALTPNVASNAERRLASRAAATAQTRPPYDPSVPPALLPDFKVVIDMPGGFEHFVVVWVRSGASLRDFRRAVCSATGMEPDAQTWPWSGSGLPELTETLHSVGVCHGDTIALRIRLRGGTNSPAKPAYTPRVRKQAVVYNAPCEPTARPAGLRCAVSEELEALTPALPNGLEPAAPLSPTKSLVRTFGVSVARSSTTSAGDPTGSVPPVSESPSAPRPPEASPSPSPLMPTPPLPPGPSPTFAPRKPPTPVPGPASVPEPLLRRDGVQQRPNVVRQRDGATLVSCPCCPDHPLIKDTNFQHFSSHEQNGQPLPVWWWAPENPVKKCPACRKVWRSTKGASGSSQCNGCKGRPPVPVGEPCAPAVQSSDPHPSSARGAAVYDGALPSLRAVGEALVRTLEHVPKKMRHKVAVAWGRAFSDAAHDKGERAWTLALMFPKCVLRAAPRGRKAYQDAADVAARLVRWEEGRYAELWGECDVINHKARGPKAHVAVGAAESKIQRAVALARIGQFSRAMASLMSKESQVPSEKVAGSLHALHPKRLVESVARRFRRSHVFSADTVRVAVKSFPAGTAAGTLGLRPEFWQDLVNADLSGTFLGQLGRALSSLASGDGPLSLQPVVAGAALSALKKKDGGTRPVASGEAIRRLVAKCLCIESRERACAFFAPLQFGVACSNGTERVIHRTRAVWLAHAADPNFVILKVDLKNAFNCVSREAFLEQVRRHFPELEAWAGWCYEDPSCLWYDVWEIPSDEGVQQGDPLGPLLFSLVVDELVKRIAAEQPGLVLNLWYLDDGVLGGSVADVRAAYDIILRHGPGMGLNINDAKCELIFRGADAPGRFPFPEGEKGVKRVGCDFDLLGSPIGSDVFVDAYVALKCVDKCVPALVALEGLDDPQVAYTLLRSCCAFPRLVTVLRTVPLSQCAKQLERFDVLVAASFVRAVGILGLSAAQVHQARLSTKLGGMGIRSAEHHASAAFLGSVSSCSAADSWDLPSFPGFAEALADFNSRAGAAPLRDESIAPGAIFPQCELSARLDRESLRLLVAAETAAGRKYHAGRLLNVSRPHAGSWLNVMPSIALKLSLSPPEFNVLVRWWLGAPVCSGTNVCPRCLKVTCDENGYHQTTCRFGGNLGVRHNGVRDTLYFFALGGAVGAQREATGLIPDSAERPADILLGGPPPEAADIAVTHSLQPKYIDGSIADPGSAPIRYGEEHKVKRYRTRLDAVGVKFTPVVVDCWGAWAPEAEEFIRRVAALVASRGNRPLAQCVSGIFQRLSLSLMRSNARALLQRMDPDDCPTWEDVPPEEAELDFDDVATCTSALPSSDAGCTYGHDVA